MQSLTVLGGFIWVLGVDITDEGMDPLSEYTSIKGTGCYSHRNVARLPTFKNFSSKCLEQMSERHVGAQSLLFTHIIHFLFNSGFFKGNSLRCLT